MLRTYQRVRPGVFKDPTVRKEIEKIDRWISAASPLMKNVSAILAPGATPTGNSGGSGSPGPPGTLIDHNHSRSGQGGNLLGDDTTQMEAQGNWYYDDKIGIKNTVPVGRLHIGRVAGDPYTYSRPTSTIAAGNFLRQPAADANLHLALDEVTPDDVDYISPSVLSPTSCTLGMGSVTDPGTDIGWQINVRAFDSGLGGGATFNMTLTLLEGAATIQAFTVPITNTVTTYLLNVSPANAALVSNFANLRIGWGSGSSFGNTHRCTWLELRFPKIGGLPDLGPELVLQAGASQTSDLFQGRDNADAVKAVLSATHQFALGRATPRARLDVTSLSTSELGVIVQAAAAQTVDTIQVWNSAGTPNLRIGPQGHFGMHTAPSDSRLIDAQLAITAAANVLLLNFVGTVTDNTGGFQHKGINSVLNLQGTADLSAAEHIGFYSEINHSGTNATGPAVTGAWFVAKKTGTGNVDFLTAAVFQGEMSNSGNVLQYVGCYVANPSRSSGSLTSCTGFFIENIVAGATNYSIRTAGGLHVFGDKVGINQDPPSAMLHAVCDASATVGIKVKRSTSGSTGDLIQCLNESSAKLSGFDVKGRLATPVDGATTPIFNDLTTTTKKLGLDASGIASATTRYWAALDVSGANLVAGDQAPAVSAGRMGKVDATNQGAAIASTNLTNGAKVGFYSVHYYLEVTTADAGATSVQFQIGYTDDIGATTQVGAVLALTATGRDKGEFQVYLASGELSYQTNVVTIGTAKYALRVRVVFLG